MSERIPDTKPTSERIPEAWAALLAPSVLRSASALYERARAARDAGENVLPPQGQIFRALELTPPEQVRCVIVGQDPYHTPGVANGLAFSANDGCKIPPSLRNIFKELSADLGYPAPSGPDLTPWALQGVLLLNTSLTVRAGAAGSHAAWGWQAVTGDLLRVCLELPQPIVFLLWGRHAQDAARKAGINLYGGACEDASNLRGGETSNLRGGACQDARPYDNACEDALNLFEQVPAPHTLKYALYSSHPSPLGASKSGPNFPAFLGSRPFSRTNAFLRSVGAAEIDWRLP